VLYVLGAEFPVFFFLVMGAFHFVAHARLLPLSFFIA
jgi:hypothetical protein